MPRKIITISLMIILGLLTAGLIAFHSLSTPQPKPIINIKLHNSNPTDLNFFETAYKFKKKEIDLKNREVVAGVIPHHLLAADLLAEFYHNLEGKDYNTIILIGPNHFKAGNSEIITSAYDWQTPYGKLECDSDTLKNLNISIEENVFDNEHAITAEVSFIKKTFPDAKFIPIILKQGVSSDRAAELAQKMFELSKNKKILLLASVDFSHYKTSTIAQEHDKQSISALENADMDKIYDLDIDSPASIYTLLSYSKLKNASFQLLNNSNSAILANQPDIDSTTSYVTGYLY